MAALLGIPSLATYRGACMPEARFPVGRVAFAIEFLVPMVNLSGVTEERLGEIAKERQISIHALVNQMHNYHSRPGRLT